jgi:hypothetical protein
VIAAFTDGKIVPSDDLQRADALLARSWNCDASSRPTTVVTCPTVVVDLLQDCVEVVSVGR